MDPDKLEKNDFLLSSGTTDNHDSAHSGAEPESAPPIFSPDDVICDRYRIVRFIARGGMGEVYEVEDTELHTHIALKTIAPSRASSKQQLNRFKQEIQLARKVSHPNVCRVFDLGRSRDEQHGDVLFLTMELLPGATLAAYLKENGAMTYEAALPLVRQMVSALAAAHHAGVVHRDFKPANVMLLTDPQSPTVVKVTDFGLAVIPEAEETRSELISDVAGTPAYMAPEQFQGHYSPRTDIYALGLTVYQMLTGKIPEFGQTPLLETSEHTTKRMRSRWRQALIRSMSPNPALRYASVEEFWSAVSGERLPGQTFWQALVASVRLHRWAYLSAAAVVLAFVVGVGVGVLPSPFHRLPEQKHIAVLPFENIGNDASNQAFAEGVSETLTSKLSQLERYQKSFWVVPAADTRNIKNLDEAHRDLNVTLAVTGSIEHTPDGVNLIANLVDAANHRQLSSRSIHVESGNLDLLQQRVWEQVADMLDLQVSPQIKQELALGGTSQADAYELYERANGYLQREGLDDVDHAIGLFNKAVARDPNYASAYAGLGEAYGKKYFLTKDPQWAAEGTRNAGRAVELNADLIPVRMSLARVYRDTGQLDKALAEYKRILEKDPTVIEAELRLGQVYEAQNNYPQAEAAYKDVGARRSTYWPASSELGELYYRQGQFSKAAEQFQSVIDLAPDESIGYYDLGGVYLAQGRYEDAIAVLKKGLAIQPASDAWTNLGSAYMYIGQWEEAAGAMKKAADMNPHNHIMWRNLGDSYDQIPSRLADAHAAYQKALETATQQLKVNPNDPEVLSGIALYYAHLGQAADAETFMGRALAVAPKDSDTLFTSALVYEIIGHREKALDAVAAAVAAGYSLEEVEKEPELRSLRTDPRYQRWVKTSKEKTAAS
jgi:serine/threonine protein kinase/Flp pilus assembly protein TadD